MDTTTLVRDMIEDGQKIIEQAPQAGFPITTALWLKTAEDDRWYFYVVSPAAENEPLYIAYGRLHMLIRQIPEPRWIDPLEVRLIGPSNPIAKDVLAVHNGARGPNSGPIRWGGNVLGNVGVEAAYLYPLPAMAAG